MFTDLSSGHPTEKAWTAFIITDRDKDKIREFCKSDGLVHLGPLSNATTQFLATLATFCSETDMEPVRTWYRKATETDPEKEQGCIAKLSQCQTNAKLALAVATAAKAIFSKIPKAKDRDERNQIISKAKKHIEKAKPDKAIPKLSVACALGCVTCVYFRTCDYHRPFVVLSLHARCSHKKCS